MRRITLKREPRLDAKHEAFAYQHEAVRALCDLEYGAIFHEQGLGKTKIALDIALYLLETRAVDTVLVVAKKGLISNWVRETRAHTHLRPKLLTQKREANFFAFNSPARLMLAHYEVMKSEEARFRLFLKARDVAVILDESAKIKNPKAALTSCFFALAPLFKRRFILTGTPVANRPYDLWAQIWFLDQGKALGNDFDSFRRSVDLSNRLVDDAGAQSEFEGQLAGLFDRISGFSVRRTKDSGVIKLPEKVVQSVSTEWETHQLELYEELQEHLRAIVIKGGLPTEDNAELALKRLLRLVQIACHPRLVDDSYSAVPGKLPVLYELVERAVHGGDKCIVWTSFTKSADWLAAELKGFGSVRVHGKLAMDRRDRAIGSFLSHPDCRVLVATPGAAKEGLTLTAANHVIFYDRSFSLDDYLQAQDRIHRISQVKTCYVTNLLMADSVDEWVEILLRSKQLAAQLAQGDISREYYESQISYDFGSMVKAILNID